MLRHIAQQGAQLQQAAALGPRRMYGAQMDAEHAPARVRRDDLEKCMA